jgi:hypothetical protein
MLVLANDGGLYSDLQTIWLSYMDSSPQIDCYFIKGRPEQEEQIILDETTLYIKTEEGYDEALWRKTLEAFRYFQPKLKDYDFVYRTNLSSFIQFDRFLEFCATLPRANLCSAVIGYDIVPFPSGSGFTLSCDLVNRIIEDPPEHQIMDDVTVGLALNKWGIQIVEAPRVDIEHESDKINPAVFHHRIKTLGPGRRDQDMRVHRKLLETYRPSKTTVVTMFFDLKALSDTSTELRDQSFYMKNAKATLQIPAPMVIFCDASTRGALESIRGTIAPSIYIEKNITEYDFYKENVNYIRTNRAQRDIVDPRNTPSYYLLTMFKLLALKIAKDRADFQTSHYAWIDIGCRHVLRGPMRKPAVQLCLNPWPRVAATYIHYRSHEKLQDMVSFVNSAPCGIAAGVITAEGSYVDRLYAATLSIFYEMLFKGCGHSEETVLTYCYDRYPELFTLRYGDYYSLLSNYIEPKNDRDSIHRFFIREAIRAGRYDLADEAQKLN